MIPKPTSIEGAIVPLAILAPPGGRFENGVTDALLVERAEDAREVVDSSPRPTPVLNPLPKLKVSVSVSLGRTSSRDARLVCADAGGSNVSVSESAEKMDDASVSSVAVVVNVVVSVIRV